MSRMKISWLLMLVAVFFCSSEALAEGPYPDVGEGFSAQKSGAGDVAVVIVVEDYFRLPDVAGARHTGRDWTSFFRDGLGVEQVFDLRDQEATREAILRVSAEAAQEVSNEGTLWFVFVGHGAPAADGSDGLLVGVDAQQNMESLMARGVGQQELMALLESGAQENTVLFIDACFSGRDGDGDSLVPGLQPVLPVAQVLDVGRQTVVLSAARSDEFAGALPGYDRPAFSYWMLGALRGWATQGEEVTAGEALEFTRTKLRAIPERVQTPTGAGALDLVLVRGVTEEDPLPRWDGRAPRVNILGRLHDPGGLEEPSELPEQSSERPEPRGGIALGALERTPGWQLLLDASQQPVLVTREGRFQGADIYSFFGRDDLVAQYIELEDRRDRQARAGTILALSGTAVGLVGVGLFAEAYWLRDIPTDHPEVAFCQDFEPSALRNNCYATERHELLSPWRTAGLVTALVGTTVAFFGLSWRSRDRDVHPLNLQELRDLAQQKEGRASLQELEVFPQWSPAEGGKTGITLRMRW